MKTIRHHSLTRSAIAALAAAALLVAPALQASSQGRLLAEDGFAIGPDKKKGEWTPGGVHDLGNAHIVTPGLNRVLGPAKTIHATGLDYPGLKAAGEGGIDAYDWWSYRDTVDSERNSITYDADAGFDAIYVSFLTRHPDADPVLVALGEGGDTGSRSPFQVLGTGPNHAFRLGDTTHDLGVERTADVNLWVIKFDFDGGSGDSVTVWLNPASMGGAEPASPNLSVPRPNIVFNRILFGKSGPASRLDEIRVGTSYAAVTPTP